MLRSAAQRGEPMSLLVMRSSCLPEIEILFGRNAANAAVDAVMDGLGAVAGRKGLAARTSPDTFALAMPRWTGAELVMALRRRLGHACCVELDFEEEEILLVPDLQASTIAADDSFSQAYAVLCRAMQSDRHTEERRLGHLRDEREAYTKRVTVPPEQPAPQARTRPVEAHVRFPKTLPMPVAMR